MKSVAWIATLWLAGCSLVQTVDEESVDALRAKFQGGVRPAPTQLQAGKEWRCVDCATGTKRCPQKYHALTFMKFDDIFVVAPARPGDEGDQRLAGHAFVYEGEEMFSHVYGNGGVAYLRLDPKSLGLIISSDTPTVSSFVFCDETKVKTKKN